MTKNDLLAKEIATNCENPSVLAAFLWQSVRSRIFGSGSLNTNQSHWMAAHSVTRLHDAVEDCRVELASNYDARYSFVFDALNEIDVMQSTGSNNIKLCQWFSRIEEAHRQSFMVSTAGL